MKLVFFCNFLNHHQVAVADALYNRLGEDFIFVATRQTVASDMKGGKDFSDRPYCLCATKDEVSRKETERVAIEAEVALFGAESQPFAISRARKNPSGLSFEIGERWLKRGWINLLSPVLLRWLKNYFCYYHRRPFYKLNSSGFAAQDHYRMFTYRGRCFKWGYFTQPIIVTREKKRERAPFKLLWVGRFVDWKHPEMPILLANRLKKNGYHFHLDMIGEGQERAKTEHLCLLYELNDYVSFIDNLSNDQVLTAMQQHDLCLFTSDRNEGWGVVANEAMSCGCVLVASNEIGASPFLVQDGVNGCLFQSGDIDAFENKVRMLLDDPVLMESMSRNGVKTMNGIWSAQQAADNLLQLIEDLQQGREPSIVEGPCSKENVE